MRGVLVMKFCKDCVHVLNDDPYLPKCRVGQHTLVIGRYMTDNDARVSQSCCDSWRALDGLCGPDARFWEPRDPTDYSTGQTPDNKDRDGNNAK